MNRKPWVKFGLYVVLWAGVCCPSVVWAVPDVVSYAGLVYAPNGLPITGEIDLSVSIFAAPSDGTALWTESVGEVSVVGGRFDIMLGTVDPVGLHDALASGTARWLEFTFDTETLLPRQEIVAVPYALFAGDSDALGGLPPSAYLTTGDVGAAALSNQYADLDGTPDLDTYLTADEAAATYVSQSGGTVTGDITVQGGVSVETTDVVTNQATDVLVLSHQTNGTAQLKSNGFSVDPGGTLTSGLVSYWGMDELGGTVLDLLNNNPLTATATTVVVGKSGLCRNFAGGATERLQRSGVQNYPQAAISVSVWLNTTSAANAGIFTYHTSASANTNDFLVYHPPGLQPHVNGASYESGAAITNGQWRHVVQTWQSSTGSMKLYIDGVLVADQPLAQGTSMPGGGCVVLGQEQDLLCGGFEAGQAYVGQMDEVGLWNRVLTAGEVTTLYNGGAGSFYQQLPGIGTGILFQLEDPSGDVIDAARIAAFFGDTEAETLLAFETRTAGGALIRTARLDGNGNLMIKGTLTTSGSPDIAENVVVTDPTVGPGDLVVIDEGYRVEPSNTVYDRFAVKKATLPGQRGLLGVISADPGILLHAPQESVNDQARSAVYQRPLVLVGRVPVRIDPDSPPVRPGDALTSSSTPGLAMRSDTTMPAVGRALVPWRCIPGDCPETVLAFVSPVYPSVSVQGCSEDDDTRALRAEVERLEQDAHNLANKLDQLEAQHRGTVPTTTVPLSYRNDSMTTTGQGR